MKFEYCFTLAVILVVLFSLSAVVASENVTDDASSEDAFLAIDVNDDSVCVETDLNDFKSQSVSNDNPFSTVEDVDLSVNVSGENVFHEDKYNRAGYELPWNVTAEVSNGTAKNVKVQVTLSDNMEYVSHDESIGTFNPATGIWDIGDLSSSSNATLSILTKLTSNGRFKVTANATTTSNDIDLSNNNDYLTLKSGTLKRASNSTQTSDDVGNDQPSENPGSDPGNPFIVVDEPTEDNPGGNSNSGQSSQETDDSPNQNSNSGSGSNSNSGSGANDGGSSDSSSESSSGSSSNGNGKSNQYTKSEDLGIIAESTRSISDAISGTVDSLSSIFNPNSNDNKSNSKDNVSDDVAKAVSAQDYSKFPILIFALVLILVVAIVGYGKLKS